MGISPSQGRYLHTGQHKRRQVVTPRVGFETTTTVFGRPQTARPLWSASAICSKYKTSMICNQLRMCWIRFPFCKTMRTDVTVAVSPRVQELVGSNFSQETDYPNFRIFINFLCPDKRWSSTSTGQLLPSKPLTLHHSCVYLLSQNSSGGTEFNHDIHQSGGQDLNPGRPEHETETLPTSLRTVIMLHM
jgi:hypothetical protein